MIFGWGKTLEEILATYQSWYAAGLTDKEISLKIKETFPCFSMPIIRQKRPEKPQPGSW